MQNLKQKLQLTVNKKSVVKLRRYTLRWEDKKYVLCCPQTEFFTHISRRMKMFIELIDGQRTLGEIEKILLSKHNFFKNENLPETIHSLVFLLVQWGFVERIDRLRFDYVLKEQKKDILPWLSRRILRPFFSKPVMLMASSVIMLGIVLFIINPEYLPQPKFFFWSDNYTYSIITSFILGWLFLALHELAHLCAAKYYGLRASFSLGLRLYFLVAQTNIYSIFLTKKANRMVIYLAGMTLDFFIICAGIIVLFLYDRSMVFYAPWLYKLIQQVIFLQWLGILWQFFFFMKTDLYYFISDSLGCETLLDNTKLYLKNKAVFFSKHVQWIPQRLKTWGKHQKKIQLVFSNTMEKELVPLYAFFVSIGVFLMGIRFFKYFIPVMLKTYQSGFVAITAGLLEKNLLKMGEGLTVLAIQLFHSGVTLYLFVSKSKTLQH